MSPELALVDSELAAQLRADLVTGDAFRPRASTDPPQLSLVHDIGLEDAADDEPTADVGVAAPDDVVEDADIVVYPVPEAFEPSFQEITEEPVPDYIIVESAPAAVTDEESLPDYIIAESAPGTAVAEPVSDFLDEVVVESGPEPAVSDPVSDYPVLPTLDERSDALEDAEAALRKIREQIMEEQTGRRGRVRRRVTILTGFGVLSALALVAIDVQTGVVQLPGWLPF